MNLPPLCLGLLGHPVSHSRSPAMMRAALDAAGIDGLYAAFDVAPADLPRALDGLWVLGFRGVNVTAPHKAAVRALLGHAVTPEALATGAVNTLGCGAAGWIGHNTDVEGLVLALGDAGAELGGQAVVVLGAGGAARAAVTSLRALGVGRVTVLARSAEGAAAVARVASAQGLRAVSAELGSPEAREALAGAAGVLQCTSAEVAGAGRLEVDLGPCPRGALAVDLVYCPRVTPWMARARAAGLRVVPDAGAAMLAGQGAAAFAWWTDREPPLGVMRAALDAAPERS